MTLRHVLATATLTASAGLFLTGLPAAGALAAENASNSQDSEETANGFSDEQLKQFVEAQNNVQSELQNWNEKIASADSDSRQETLQEQKKEAMVQAVEDSGLEPDTYNAIAQQAQNDPALTKRIQSFMEPR